MYCQILHPPTDKTEQPPLSMIHDLYQQMHLETAPDLLAKNISKTQVWRRLQQVTEGKKKRKPVLYCRSQTNTNRQQEYWKNEEKKWPTPSDTNSRDILARWFTF